MNTLNIIHFALYIVQCNFTLYIKHNTILYYTCYIKHIIKQDIRIYIYILPIAGQTAGLNGLKFFVDTQECGGGCYRQKIIQF